jgi:hypothetical protein
VQGWDLAADRARAALGADDNTSEAVEFARRKPNTIVLEKPVPSSRRAFICYRALVEQPAGKTLSVAEP